MANVFTHLRALNAAPPCDTNCKATKPILVSTTFIFSYFLLYTCRTPSPSGTQPLMIKNLIDSALWFSILVSLAALWCIVLKCFYHGNEENKNHVYPPGPPQDCLIGNLRQVPKNNFGATFCEWGRRYGMSYSVDSWVWLTGVVEIGPVVYVKLPGMSMVIVNSHEVAQDILSKRTHTTAGRRMGYMIQELYVSIPLSNPVLCLIESAETPY